METKKRQSRFATLLLVLAVFLSLAAAASEPAVDDNSGRPNVILVFLDDAGFADFGVTGSSTPTPTIDALARGGVQFTQFYDASPVCSASRAALLTGRYPDRFSFKNVLFPDDTTGLPQDEETLAELLKGQGYSTHIFGKWHLGHLRGALPLAHGFDAYYGIPYSNDMWPYKRDSEALDPNDEQAYTHDPDSRYLPLPLYEGNEIVKAAVTPADQKVLTQAFTDKAIEVIEAKSSAPFFIYLPYSAAHIPLFVRDEILGKSGGNLYQDVIYEHDVQMARIMKALRDEGIEQDTLIIFTSDNGPWTVFGDHAGSAGDLRGFKMTTFEGGIRVFAAMHWPAGFGQGVIVDSPTMTIDILPTIAEIVGATPSGEELDGRSLVATIRGSPTQNTETRPLYNFFLGKLESMRYGKWKLHFPREVRTVTREGSGGFRGDYGKEHIDWSLYDLDADPGERVNLADRYPLIVKELQEMAAAFSSDLEAGKKPMGRYGQDAFESRREQHPRAHDFDVKHYRIALFLDEPTRSLSGETDVTFASAIEALGEVVLNAESFTVHEVARNDRPLVFSHQDGRLEITLDRALAKGEEATLTVGYSVADIDIDSAAYGMGAGYDLGFTFQPETPSNPAMIHTLSFPEGARHWFPSFDHPSDWATHETIIEVREAYRVVANGALVSDTVDQKTGRRTVHWNQSKPQPTYLCVMVAGNYSVLDDRHGDLPLHYWVYPGDEADARLSFSPTPDMVGLFEELYGVKYPWAKYDQVIIPGISGSVRP